MNLINNECPGFLWTLFPFIVIFPLLFATIVFPLAEIEIALVTEPEPNLENCVFITIPVSLSVK